METSCQRKGNVIGMAIWFAVIAVISIIILVFWKPEIVQKKDVNGEPIDEIDSPKIVLASFIVSLTFIIIIYLVTSSKVYNREYPLMCKNSTCFQLPNSCSTSKICEDNYRCNLQK